MSLIINDIEHDKIEFDDYKQMENYNLQEIDNGDIYAFYQLLEYYYEIENNEIKGENFETIAINKLYNIAIETQNMKLLSRVSEYYCDQQKYSKMIKCCAILLKNDVNDNAANIQLAEYYQHYNDYENMIYHYKMLNNPTPYLLNKMAFYYKTKKNYDNMIKCYLLAIDKNDIDAMRCLGDYYVKIKEFDKAKLYYEMILNDNSCSKHSNLIKKIITKNLGKFNSIKECFICCIENIHTKFKCGHEICIDCINQLDRCYYRCN
jgi:tetratricopeptide (TPR) repeat protein